MTITCILCGSLEFYIKDGSYFCQACHAESLEHGRETLVDDESFGTFGDSASTLKRKRIAEKKKKRSQKTAPKFAFTTTDISSYVLKAWVDELITLGGSPNINKMALSIYARFLQTQNLAFVPEPGLSKYPTYRDVQVNLLNRKHVMNHIQVKALNQRRTRPNKKKKTSDDIPATDASAENSIEARKVRKRSRRKFFTTLIGENNESFGGESSSSLSSFGSSTSFMSDSSEANSSVIEDDSESDEDEDAAKAADHARIIKRFTFRRPHIGSAELRLDLHSLFGCFVLAILTDHRSCITWTDLCFWIRTGALGLRLAAEGVPPELELMELEKHQFCLRPKTSLFNYVQSAAVLVGKTIELHDVYFTYQDKLKRVMFRILVELGLPKSLWFSLRKALGDKCEELFHLKFHFSQLTPPTSVLPGVDIRCLAFILFWLKYLFGLDDVTEDLLSMNAKKQDRKDVFVFSEWLKATKIRAACFVKHSVYLGERFQSLFPLHVPTNATKLRKLHIMHRETISKHSCMTKEEAVFSFFYRTPRSIEQNKKMSDMVGQVKPPKEPEFDNCDYHVARSRKPMSEFTAYCLEHRDNLQLSPKETEALELLSRSRHQKLVFKNKTKARIDNPILEVNYGDKLEMTELNLDPNEIGPLRNKPYWIRASSILGLEPKPLGRVKWNAIQEQLRSELPENFLWLWNYFALIVGCHPVLIYSELNIIERTVLLMNSNFFGKDLVKPLVSKKKKKKKRSRRISDDSDTE